MGLLVHRAARPFGDMQLLALLPSPFSMSDKKMLKLGFLGSMGKLWIEDGYVNYRGTYGGYFKVRLGDIQTVNADMGGKTISTKANLRLIGGGVDLASVTMNRQVAEQARDWIIENKG